MKRYKRCRAGFTLPQLVLGCAVAGGVALLLGKALSGGAGATANSAKRQQAQIELQTLVERIHNDFKRHRPNGIELLPSGIFSPTGAGSKCRDLRIHQTMLGPGGDVGGVRSILYRTSCQGGPEAPAGPSFSDTFEELSTGCRRAPAVVVSVSEGATPLPEPAFPRRELDAAMVCFHGDAPTQVRAEVALGYREQGQQWKVLRRSLILGGNRAEGNIEIIPPR